jgi:endogenous inhibitor of DNA gyrase (YacG/DUF329 family)
VTWLSKPALLWAFDEAPEVPARLVSTLLAVARYAGTDGRGSHPSAATLAAMTRKTERQAKRDLAELEKLKLVRRGNQRTVAYIRADRRPTVYDLAMPRGDTHDTPSGGHGVTPRVERGDTQGQNGVSPMSPEEVLKTSGKRARDRAGAQSPPAKPETRIAAPPCPECGQPFIREQLAEEAHYVAAMAGLLVHEGCEAPQRRDCPRCGFSAELTAGGKMRPHGPRDRNGRFACPGRAMTVPS